MEEVWKDISGYEGLYKISSLGRVFSLKRNRILKPFVSRWGYEIVSLTDSGRSKKEAVHRLVAKHFVDNPNNYAVVDHVDGNKRNNSASNLEWCTAQENARRAFDNGLCEACKAASRRTQKNILSKCREKQKKQVKATNLATGETKIYESVSACARAIGAPSSNVCKTLKDKEGRKQVAGFTVSYVKGDEDGKSIDQS